MKTQSKYYSGLSPKRGSAKQFRELDDKLKELNRELTHFIIGDVSIITRGTYSNTVNNVRLEIEKTKTEIKQYSTIKELNHETT